MVIVTNYYEFGKRILSLIQRLTKIQLSIIDTKLHDIIHVLESAFIEKQEILDGYVYNFSGTDQILNAVFLLIESKRSAHRYLKFELTVQDISSNIRLKITGPDGTKEILRQEIKVF